MLYPIWAFGNPNIGYSSIFIITVTGYFAFFAVFMIAVALRYELLMRECAFLDTVFKKSLFYVFLASLAWCDFRFWLCDIAGPVMGGMAVLSWMNYFGKRKNAEG